MPPPSKKFKVPFAAPTPRSLTSTKQQGGSSQQATSSFSNLTEGANKMAEKKIRNDETKKNIQPTPSVNKATVSSKPKAQKESKPTTSLSDQQYEKIFSAAISRTPKLSLSQKSSFHEKFLREGGFSRRDSEDSADSDDESEGQGKASSGRHTPQGSTERHTLQASTERHTPQGSIGRHTPQGSIGRHTPQGSTGRHTPQGSTGRHTLQGSTERHTLQASTERHTPQGSTGRHTPQGSTGRHTPQGSTGRHTPQGSTERHTLQASTERHTPQGSTGRHTPQGSTGRHTPQGSTGRHAPQGSTGRQTPQGGSKEVLGKSGRPAGQDTRRETFIFPGRRLNCDTRDSDCVSTDSFSPSRQNSQDIFETNTPDPVLKKKSSTYDETPHLPSKRKRTENERNRPLEDPKETDAGNRHQSPQESDDTMILYIRSSQISNSEISSFENYVDAHILTASQENKAQKTFSCPLKSPPEKTQNTEPKSALSKLKPASSTENQPSKSGKKSATSKSGKMTNAEQADKENFVKPLPKPKRKGNEIRAKPGISASEKSFPQKPGGSNKTPSQQSTTSSQSSPSPTALSCSEKSNASLSEYSQPAPGLSKIGVLQWLQDRRMNGTWVECTTCKKWRHLTNMHDPTMIPAVWVCSMNDDEECDSCQKMERRMSLKEEAQMIYNKYAVGSLVWARVEGYPWWPAIVDDDSDFECFYWMDSDLTLTPDWYHVVFLDKPASRAWIREKDLKPYYGNRLGVKETGSQTAASLRPAFSRKLNQAKRRIAEAQEMEQIERIRTFGFLAQGFLKGKGSKATKVTKHQKKDSARSVHTEDGSSDSVSCCDIANQLESHTNEFSGE